jgi:hypothetical protein
MVVTGTRIRSLNRLAGIPDRQEIIVGLTDLERFQDRLREVGFADNAVAGETVLPAALGPVSLYNAEGKEVPQRDQPMETAYRQVEWHWHEFHGRDTVEKSRIVDVPYARYPRVFYQPPSIELTLTTDDEGHRLLITEPIAFSEANADAVLHRVNLLLELFGECDVMDAGLGSINTPHIRRVNWRIMPQGRMPWQRLRRELLHVIEREPEGSQPVIQHRLETVNAHEPEFVAVGIGGFQGYVIFGFPRLEVYVLESARYGNATYVLGDDWETISQRTKAEILNENLQQARLVHREGWDRQLAALFQPRRRPAV